MTEPGFWHSRMTNVQLFLLLTWNEHSGEVLPNLLLQMCALYNSETLLMEKVTNSHLPHSLGVPMSRHALILTVHVANGYICIG